MNSTVLNKYNSVFTALAIIVIAVIIRLTVAHTPSQPPLLPPEHAKSAPRDYPSTYKPKDLPIKIGDVLTSNGLESSYYMAPTMKRYVFPNQATLQTWYPVPEFTIKNIDRKTLEAIPLAGNVTYRAGMRIIKFATDPEYYVVSKGGVLHAASTSILATLYGTNWNKRVDALEEYYRTNYVIASPLSSSSDYSPIDEYNSSPTISVDKGLVSSLKK